MSYSITDGCMMHQISQQGYKVNVPNQVGYESAVQTARDRCKAGGHISQDPAWGALGYSQPSGAGTNVLAGSPQDAPHHHSCRRHMLGEGADAACKRF